MSDLSDSKNSSFCIIDKVAIFCICKFLNVYDVLSLKRCSTRLHCIVGRFLKEEYFKSEYLDRQRDLISTEISNLESRLQQLKKTLQQTKDYKTLHNNIRPDAYMTVISRLSINLVYPTPQWIYCSTEHVECLASYNGRILVKSGQPSSTYSRIQMKMDAHGFKRVFMPPEFRKRTDIRMMFTANNNNNLAKFYPCKICKGDHPIIECPKANCHLCKQFGHLTQRCPQSKCKICKKTGKHLTSRCPRIQCKNCNRKGHIAIRCRTPGRNKPAKKGTNKAKK